MFTLTQSPSRQLKLCSDSKNNNFVCHEAPPPPQAILERLMRRITESLGHIEMYLDDAIAFDNSPTLHMYTPREFLSRRRAHDLNLSLTEARLGAADLDCLKHSTSPEGLYPDTNKVRAVAASPMPTTISELRSLLDILSRYLTFSPNLSTLICHLLASRR
ncbi:unnamed protein product, partial [Sphacelaria rigidula]